MPTEGPALIDVGVETYTAKTFSNRRYEIWTMQSAYHNLPTINGVMQKEGRDFAARDVIYKADADKAVFGLDLAKCYPAEAGVISWKRTLTFVRGQEIVLNERYALKEVRAPLQLSLMSARRPEKTEDGRIVLANPDGGSSSPPLSILYDKKFFTAEIETIALEDDRLKSSWGPTLYRILFTAPRTPAKGEYSIRIISPSSSKARFAGEFAR